MLKISTTSFYVLSQHLSVKLQTALLIWPRLEKWQRTAQKAYRSRRLFVQSCCFFYPCYLVCHFPVLHFQSPLGSPSLTSSAVCATASCTSAVNNLNTYHCSTCLTDGVCSSWSGSRLSSFIMFASRTGSSLLRNMNDDVAVFADAFFAPCVKHRQQQRI